MHETCDFDPAGPAKLPGRCHEQKGTSVMIPLCHDLYPPSMMVRIDQNCQPRAPKISQSPDPFTQAAHHKFLRFNFALKSEQPLKSGKSREESRHFVLQTRTAI